MRGRKSRYVHLLRAMRKGDVLYIPEHMPRLDKSITAVVFRCGGKCLTACFTAVTPDPSTAHRVVRITMLKPLRER